MRRARGGRLLLALAVLFLALHMRGDLLRGCAAEGEEEEGSPVAAEEPEAPMEDKEKAALYAAIGSFVGKAWNGSGLFPDPCGQTPIQGVSCDLFNGLWYPTVVSIGQVQPPAVRPPAPQEPHLLRLLLGGQPHDDPGRQLGQALRHTRDARVPLEPGPGRRHPGLPRPPGQLAVPGPRRQQPHRRRAAGARRAGEAAAARAVRERAVGPRAGDARWAHGAAQDGPQQQPPRRPHPAGARRPREPHRRAAGVRAGHGSPAGPAALEQPAAGRHSDAARLGEDGEPGHAGPVQRRPRRHHPGVHGGDAQAAVPGAGPQPPLRHRAGQARRAAEHRRNVPQRQQPDGGAGVLGPVLPEDAQQVRLLGQPRLVHGGDGRRRADRRGGVQGRAGSSERRREGQDGWGWGEARGELEPPGVLVVVWPLGSQGRRPLVLGDGDGVVGSSRFRFTDRCKGGDDEEAYTYYYSS